MVNALLVAMELNAMLPDETPANTEGYEGFFHLCDMNGSVEHAEMTYILRDHSEEIMAARKATLIHAAKRLNEKYGKDTVELYMKEQYRNMTEKIKPCMHLTEKAMSGAESLGSEARVQPIRGGSDGARLGLLGGPCA